MSKETFTDEQRKELEANQYTKLVGSHYIRFTDTFWQEFGRRFLSGEDRYDICRSMGYDPDVIGSKRLEYICRTIRNAQDPASILWDLLQIDPDRVIRDSADGDTVRMGYIIVKIGISRKTGLLPGNVKLA